MDNKEYDLKKGLLVMLIAYTLWGFQPLYWAIDDRIDTFIMMAVRILGACASCIVILACSGKLKLLKEALRDKAVMKREIPAGILLFLDWFIYLIAVTSGRVMECSLGYYIMPLVMFAFGAIIYKEKTTWKHYVILGLVVIGIILSFGGFGGFPYVTILLSVCFAVYSAVKKSLTIDSTVSTTIEVLVMVPLAAAYIIVMLISGRAADFGSAGDMVFMLGGGIVTALPIVFFAIGVKCLPLTFTAMMQYLSPTIGLFCGLILGETFSGQKMLSFVFIWAGLALYLVNVVNELRQKRKCDQ